MSEFTEALCAGVLLKSKCLGDHLNESIEKSRVEILVDALRHYTLGENGQLARQTLEMLGFPVYEEE